jgi:hypothetical protein
MNYFLVAKLIDIQITLGNYKLIFIFSLLLFQVKVSDHNKINESLYRTDI